MAPASVPRRQRSGALEATYEPGSYVGGVQPLSKPVVALAGDLVGRWPEAVIGVRVGIIGATSDGFGAPGVTHNGIRGPFLTHSAPDRRGPGELDGNIPRRPRSNRS